MPLRPASLLLLRVVLGIFVPGGCCGSPSHFLRYYYLEVAKPSQGQSQFFISSYLDDQPIARFDSLTRKMEPQVSWMEEEKETFLVPESVFTSELEEISKLSHPTEGLHTWQTILGCELREDGSKGGFFHYGYDGMDFISFNKENCTWVAPHPQAMKVKETWEEDPGWSQRNKIYLEKTCIERLQKYLLSRKKEHTKTPVVKVTHKMFNDSLEVVIYQAFGFYPKEIQANWTRDGEVFQYETLHRNVTPNSDGTYYLNLSIDIDPKEKDHFQCHLEHEALVKTLKEETAKNWWIPVVCVLVVAVVVVVTAAFCRGEIIFLIGWCVSRRRTVRQKTKFSLDDSALELVSSTPTSGRGENESLLESKLQSVVIMEDRASHGGCSSQRALEDSGSILRMREGKQQSLREYKSWSGDLDTLDKAEATESEESKERREEPKAKYLAVRSWRRCTVSE